MYKYLLCWRYLRSRYIALASIVSVTLGVATMIVVNSVMAGFSNAMESCIHEFLSDVIFESNNSLSGMPDPQWHMDEIQRVAGPYIEGMTTSVQVFALLHLKVNGQWITRDVMLIGIDEETHGRVGQFNQYLQHPENRKQLSFLLRESGYDARRKQGKIQPDQIAPMERAGWIYRRARAQFEKTRYQQQPLRQEPIRQENHPIDPFAAARGDLQPFEVFDPEKEQHSGIILGVPLCSFKTSNGSERFLALPGDDVKITFPNSGMPPEPVSDSFTIVDLYESKMFEYDSKFVFMPLKKLQELRGLIDPQTGTRFVSTIQIKLKDPEDSQLVRDLLRDATRSDSQGLLFPPQFYHISTWRDKQSALLSAIAMETMILNLLLFMIIAVAGFGILAIFFMIVFEKTRDIGILKSLGASGGGIMSIFLAYGLSLGTVGAGAGLALGLLFVRYINEIAAFLSEVTGRPVFDQQIYFFQEIPTIIDTLTISWIVGGAIVIAVVASIFPSLRAARMHPVEALRYE